MGLFGLGKKKEMHFEKKCVIEGPHYLKGNFQDIEDRVMNSFRMKENDFTWTRQLKSSNGNTKFHIKFNGELRKSLIYPVNGLPQIVIAIDPDTGAEIELFDGAKHGYNAVFWMEFSEDVKDRKIESKLNLNGNDLFDIVVLVRYHLGLKEQFDSDFEEKGFVENNRGEKLPQEAYFNGYDSIQIFAIDSEGKRFEIICEETA